MLTSVFSLCFLSRFSDPWAVSLRLALLLIPAVLQTSCREISLPPLPAPEFGQLEAPVRSQLETAHAAALRSPRDAGLSGRLGQLYHAYGRLDEAVACYRRASTLEPDARWTYLIAKIEMGRGSGTEALRWLERTLLERGDLTAAHLLLGELHRHGGRLSEASRSFSRALELEPRSPQALLGAARVLAAQGRGEEARVGLEKAVELAPRWGEAVYELALLYRTRGDMKRARELLGRYRGARESPPSHDPYLEEVEALKRDSHHLFRQVNSRFKHGEYEIAARLYREILEQNPRLKMAHYNLALSLQRLGRHDEAIPHYEAYLRERPEAADARNNLGLCFFERDRFAEAVDYFEQAIASDPGYAPAHTNLGLALERLGQEKEAMDALRGSLKVRPWNVGTHVRLARLLTRAGDAPGAEQEFLEVLRLEPAHRVAHQYLRARLGGRGERVAVFLRSKDLEEAAQYALRAGGGTVRKPAAHLLPKTGIE